MCAYDGETEEGRKNGMKKKERKSDRFSSVIGIQRSLVNGRALTIELVCIIQRLRILQNI